MAGDAGLPAWTPERYKEEIDLIFVELQGIPANQQLGYFRGRIAGFPEPYRTATETVFLQGGAVIAMNNQLPPGPFGFLKDAIQAVPAVRYALGVAGVVTVIAILASFRISPRVAVVGFPVILISMTLLVIFAKLASAKPDHFLFPLVVLMWFSIIIMILMVGLIFTGVFFKWPLDLHRWLAVMIDTSVKVLPALQIK